MTLIIVFIILLSYLLIATERISNINKAAVSIFAGTVGWVLYICYGTDYVMDLHPMEYIDYLRGAVPTSYAVKEYIAANVFLKYVGQAAEVVLFLLATMTIVEILYQNGCFNFVTALLRTKSSRKILWILSALTFVLSANLDNQTTTIMMLTIMHQAIPNRRQRMILGASILLSATCGGALTVIGDPMGLVLWNMGAVDATNFSMSLLLPCLIAWAVPVAWLGRMLPERIETERMTLSFRGDDTRLNAWQRLLMFLVGIGGLWFIPSFHSITHLSPFLGALCVLSVLWVVNEVVNRRLMDSDNLERSSYPRTIQYGAIQMMLYVMGIMLAIGVLRETNVLTAFDQFLTTNVHNHWITGIATGVISTVLDNFATSMNMFSMHPVETLESLPPLETGYLDAFVTNGAYWKIIAYASAMGGNVLAIGSMSGLALLKMERMHVGWYFKHVGWKALVGALIGLAALWIVLS